MHVVHLAVGVDLIASMLQEVTDDKTIFPESSREKRLNMVYASYKLWANQSKVQDLAGKKLFTTGVLSNTKVVEVSQKVLSATACRYMILWAAIFMNSVIERVEGLPKLYMPLAFIQTCVLQQTLVKTTLGLSPNLVGLANLLYSGTLLLPARLYLIWN